MAKQAIEGASRLNAFSIEPEKLTLITDARDMNYDPRVAMSLDENLVLNVMAYNVKQPVIVAKDGDDIVVVDGRQRVRAAVEANKRLKKEGKTTIKIPVMLQRGDSKDLFGMTIFLNEQRQDDSPVAKAEKAKRYIEMGASEDEAAVTFGVSVATIRAWMKLFDLAPKVREAVNSGAISAAAAAKLAPLKKSEQVEEMEKLLSAGEKVTAKKATATVKKSRGEVVIEKPSAKVLRSLANWTEFGDEMEKAMVSPDQFLNWVLGDVSAEDTHMDRVLDALFVAKEAEDETQKMAAEEAKG